MPLEEETDRDIVSRDVDVTAHLGEIFTHISGGGGNSF